jgi:hypothetical protein
MGTMTKPKEAVMRFEVAGCYVIGGDASTFSKDVHREDFCDVIGSDLAKDMGLRVRKLVRNMACYDLEVTVRDARKYPGYYFWRLTFEAGRVQYALGSSEELQEYAERGRDFTAEQIEQSEIADGQTVIRPSQHF